MSYLPARLGRSIEVRRLQPDDPALKYLPLGDSVLRYRFDQNAMCFGAFRGNSIIGCLWLCVGAYNEDEVRCRYKLKPANQTAWDFDVYVAPAARGSFTFLKLWDAANDYLREQGITWSLSRIFRLQPQFPQGTSDAGSVSVCARGWFLRLGNLQLMVSSVRPFVHLSFSSSHVPMLSLYVREIKRPK